MAEAITDIRPGADAVESLLHEVRLVQRRAVGVVAALTTAALANSREGAGPVPEDVLGSGGTIGRNENRAEIERARVAF